jgi:hypothetical protein
MTGIVIWGAVAIAAMIAAAVLASQKNRNRSYWMAWCFVLPPLVIVLALLGRAENRPSKRRSRRGDDEDEIEDVLDADR